MKVHGKRALLNGPGFQSTAAVVAEVEDTSDWDDGKSRNGSELTNRWSAEPNSTLRISDCDRAVELMLDMETAADWRNSIRKVDVLISALVALRHGLVEERVRYLDRVKRLPK